MSLIRTNPVAAEGSGALLFREVTFVVARGGFEAFDFAGVCCFFCGPVPSPPASSVSAYAAPTASVNSAHNIARVCRIILALTPGPSPTLWERGEFCQRPSTPPPTNRRSQRFYSHLFASICVHLRLILEQEPEDPREEA